MTISLASQCAVAATDLDGVNPTFLAEACVVRLTLPYFYITLAGLIRLSLPKGEGRVRVGGFDFCSVQNPSPQSSPLVARGEAGIVSEFLYVK
jgi:hypothetical protein